MFIHFKEPVTFQDGGVVYNFEAGVKNIADHLAAKILGTHPDKTEDVSKMAAEVDSEPDEEVSEEPASEEVVPDVSLEESVPADMEVASTPVEVDTQLGESQTDQTGETAEPSE